MEAPANPREMSDAETALERVRRDLDVLLPRNHNAATITVNAGGIGVWIAVTCCLMSLVVNVALGFAMLNQARKIDELNAYVTATYMISPAIQAQVNKSKPKGE